MICRPCRREYARTQKPTSHNKERLDWLDEWNINAYIINERIIKKYATKV